jgi:hypothetical protein
MVEPEAVAGVAIKDTSVGGNNCPENHAHRHVTRITTSANAFTSSDKLPVCEEDIAALVC